MSTIAEIEVAIKQLPASQVEELAAWMEAFRLRQATPPVVERWLQHARGAARPGETTANILAITRGDV